MNYCLIVFASFATASRVKNLLLKNYNIKSEVIQTPAIINLKSCSYCLKLNCSNADTAWEAVKKNSLSSKGVYSMKDYTKLR